MKAVREDRGSMRRADEHRSRDRSRGVERCGADRVVGSWPFRPDLDGRRPTSARRLRIQQSPGRRRGRPASSRRARARTSSSFLRRSAGIGAELSCRHAGAHAACASFAFSAAKAQSSQGVSASRSAVSTVAPHQMRRPGGRVAIGADVEGDALLLQRGRDPLGEGRRPPPCRCATTSGSAITRQTLVLDGRRGILREVRDPGRRADPVEQRLRVRVRAGDEPVEPALALRPVRARRGNPRRRAWRAC